MSQSIVNSEQFQPSGGVKTMGAVPFLDAAPTQKAAVQGFAVWPIVVIGLGGIATLAWNGFLIWYTARALIGWVTGEM